MLHCHCLTFCSKKTGKYLSMGAKLALELSWLWNVKAWCPCVILRKRLHIWLMMMMMTMMLLLMWWFIVVSVGFWELYLEPDPFVPSSNQITILRTFVVVAWHSLKHHNCIDALSRKPGWALLPRRLSFCFLFPILQCVTTMIEFGQF